MSYVLSFLWHPFLITYLSRADIQADTRDETRAESGSNEDRKNNQLRASKIRSFIFAYSLPSMHFLRSIVINSNWGWHTIIISIVLNNRTCMLRTVFVLFIRRKMRRCIFQHSGKDLSIYSSIIVIASLKLFHDCKITIYVRIYFLSPLKEFRTRRCVQGKHQFSQSRNRAWQFAHSEVCT